MLNVSEKIPPDAWLFEPGYGQASQPPLPHYFIKMFSFAWPIDRGKFKAGDGAWPPAYQLVVARLRRLPPGQAVRP
jgi:hypothetical protein